MSEIGPNPLDAKIVWLCKPPPEYLHIEYDILKAFEINRALHAEGECKLERHMDVLDKETGCIWDVLWTDDNIEIRHEQK